MRSSDQSPHGSRPGKSSSPVREPFPLSAFGGRVAPPMEYSLQVGVHTTLRAPEMAATGFGQVHCVLRHLHRSRHMVCH